MTKSLLTILLASSALLSYATNCDVTSPDGKLVVSISDNGGKLSYSVKYDGKEMLTPSRLGMNTTLGDYTQNVRIAEQKSGAKDTTYTMTGAKASTVHYVANTLTLTAKADGARIPVMIDVQVSNNDVAYRYRFQGPTNWYNEDPRHVTVKNEVTSFNFPDKTTTFICPQIQGGTGWKATKPSYEEEYKPDAPLTDKSKFGVGYTFPCLFHVGDDGWVLINETGVTSNYCATHVSDYDPSTGYTIAFPGKEEAFGYGNTEPYMGLPAATPWRTITVGSTLKPIAETTVAYDVVDELYRPSQDYKPGRYVWSWLIWQDNSINYKDQKEFIDVAAAMGYEYVLVDGFWDEKIGRDKIAELSRYAHGKGVSLMLWYNSNGAVNDAPQTPRHRMSSAIAREAEMAWMESIGIKGIKVDFFGSDKQVAMAQYEDILSDANRHGIQVIFHGCTLPRGWEKMYPNFVSSEAVLASENVYFNEHHAKQEGFELTLHPFCRNAVASMDWGGTMMNHYMSKDNKSRHRRYTSDTFEMAAAIMNQASIQCICLQKSNLDEMQPFQKEFLQSVPTTWEETRYVDGYPTKYAVLARKSTAGKWYVTGLNGETTARALTLSLPMLAGKTVTYYYDEPGKKGTFSGDLKPARRTAKVGKDGKLKVTMQGMGGVIIAE